MFVVELISFRFCEPKSSFRTSLRQLRHLLISDSGKLSLEARIADPVSLDTDLG